MIFPPRTTLNLLRSRRILILSSGFSSRMSISAAGLVTYFVFFFIHLGSRKEHIVGITPHPSEGWMKQIARNVIMDGWGFLSGFNYLIRDRDAKFCKSFCSIIPSGGVQPLKLPPRSPNLNAFAERWDLSIKSE